MGCTYRSYDLQLTPEQKKIQDEALAFAQKNKKEIAKNWTDPLRFIPEDDPVSVFMAGSPGAGCNGQVFLEEI